MELKKAATGEKDKITEFYRYVIEHSPGMEENVRWIYGLHPSDALIHSYIEQGLFFYLEEAGEIAAACALTPGQEESYRVASWAEDLLDEEVCVVHLLCTNPKLQKKGYARCLLEEMVSISRQWRKKYIRLDTLKSNVSAQHLYESFGFDKRGVQNWFTQNAGWVDFYLYEYKL